MSRAPLIYLLIFRLGITLNDKIHAVQSITSLDNKHSKCMKSIIQTTLTFFIFYFSFSIIHAQVAINEDNSVADASAILDLQSIDKGFLLPRMSTAERLAICLLRRAY